MAALGRISRSLLTCFMGVLRAYASQYPGEFRAFNVAVAGIIAMWFIISMSLVWPAIFSQRELRHNQGSGHLLVESYAKALLVFIFLFVLVRAIQLWPRLAGRAARWYAQTTRCKACFARMILWDGPVYMFIVSSLLLGLTTMRSADELAYKNEHIPNFLMMYALCSAVVGAFCLNIVLWQKRLMLAAIQRCPTRNRGAPPDLINHLQTCAFDENVFGDVEGRLYPGECVICLATWEPSDKIKVTPCQHAFHKECVETWLQTARTCAMCRRDLVKAVEELKASACVSRRDDEPSSLH